MPDNNPLSRAIVVDIDRPSWRSQVAPYKKPLPKALSQQAGPFSVHLLQMLLRLGELTTPSLSPQSGVARLWPLLRYLHAIAETPGFRFRQKWKDTDPHQKGIASDDLGVGLGMTVLYNAFNYAACVNGRDFLHRVGQLGLLAQQNGMPPKVGKMKMADYAAVDLSNRFHLIECKGTQHAASSLERAMTDGRDQKLSLQCGSPGTERRLIGQRLVVGTQLMLEGAHGSTRVVVQDPAPEADAVELKSGVPTADAIEPVIRLDIARALGAAGAERTAVAIAQSDRAFDAPALEGPDQRERTQTAFAADEDGLEAFFEHEEGWLGERVTVPLLEPLHLDGKIYRYARLVKGISKELLAEIRESAAPDVLFQRQYPTAAGRLGRSRTVLDGSRAAIVRSGISVSEIALLERRSG